MLETKQGDEWKADQVVFTSNKTLLTKNDRIPSCGVLFSYADPKLDKRVGPFFDADGTQRIRAGCNRLIGKKRNRSVIVVGVRSFPLVRPPSSWEVLPVEESLASL